MLKSTREAARLLNVKPTRLARAVWDGRIDPPAKGPGGAFAWSSADIRRASEALHGGTATVRLREGHASHE